VYLYTSLLDGRASGSLYKRLAFDP